MNDIFENQQELVDNFNKSAESLGFGQQVSEEETPVVVKIKQGCKLCWGRGWVLFSSGGSNGFSKPQKKTCKCVRISYG